MLLNQVDFRIFIISTASIYLLKLDCCARSCALLLLTQCHFFHSVALRAEEIGLKNPYYNSKTNQTLKQQPGTEPQSL